MCYNILYYIIAYSTGLWGVSEHEESLFWGAFHIIGITETLVTLGYRKTSPILVKANK